MPSTSLGIIVQHSARASLPNASQAKVPGARQTLEQEDGTSVRLSPRFNFGLNVGVVLIVLATVTANVVYVVHLVA